MGAQQLSNFEFWVALFAFFVIVALYGIASAVDKAVAELKAIRWLLEKRNKVDNVDERFRF